MKAYEDFSRNKNGQWEVEMGDVEAENKTIWSGSFTTISYKVHLRVKLFSN